MANILEEANDLGGTDWFENANAVVTPNYAVAPDASTTASRLIDNNAGGTGNVQSANNVTLSTSTTYVAHGYFKADQTDVVRLQMGSLASLDLYVTANLTSGTITASGANISSSFITAYPNDWYWVGFVFVSDSSDTTGTYIVRCGSGTVTLNGTNSILAVGCWLETGSTASETYPLVVGYDVVEEIFHYADLATYPFTYGTIYYFNPNSTSGTGTGLSNANAFYTSAQINAKSFAQGDKLLFRAGTSYTIPSHGARIKNTTMRGDDADEFFYIGAYHMVGATPTPGLGGEARPIIQGISPGIFDAYGGMSEAQAQTIVPTPAISGGLIQDGSQEGLLGFFGQSIAHIRVGDLHVRYSGGRCIRMSNGANQMTGGFLMQNMFLEGSFKQNLHIGGVYDVIIEDCFFTLSELETTYGANPGNTQAHTASKGTEDEYDTAQNHTWRRNLLWDSLGSEAMSTNSGFKGAYFLDNIMIDTGKVLGHYIDRTYDVTVMRNILIRTGRTLFHDWEGAPVNDRDGYGFMCQNEKATGSFPWNVYNTAADFARYQTQRALIAFNIVVGTQDNIGIVSQASTAADAQPLHLGEAHSGGVYFYCNLSLDPSQSHIGAPTGTSGSNYVLRTDIPPRIWGNIFYTSPTGEMASETQICDTNNSTFVSVLTNNYRSSNVTSKSNMDQNETTSGLVMPLDDYFDLSDRISVDAQGHATYDNIRSFVTDMGVNPDNLAEKDLVWFKPTANVSSGIDAADLTVPPANTWQDTLTDIEGTALPTTVNFGPFAGVQDVVEDVSITMTRPSLTVTPIDMEVAVSGNIAMTMTTPSLSLTAADMTLQFNRAITMTTPILSMTPRVFTVTEESVAPPRFVRMVFTMDMPTMTFREI